MELQEFADRNRLRTKLDPCGDKIIPGKLGHLYEHDGALGVCLIAYKAKNMPSVALMRSRQRKIEALKPKIKQRADGEGISTFELETASQTALIARLVKLCGIRRIGKPRGRPLERQLAPKALD